MTTSKSKFLTACAASVLLAVALSACGGGGGSGPATDGDDMMPGDGDDMMPGDGDDMMPGDGDDMMPGDGDAMMPTHPFVGDWAADWPGGARTVLQITGVSSDGQVSGTFRHQERGREPIDIEFSPDSSNTAGRSSGGLATLASSSDEFAALEPLPTGTISITIEDGVLRFSYEGLTFVLTFTEDDDLQLTIEVEAEMQSVTIVMNPQVDDGDDDMMPGDGDDMMPGDGDGMMASDPPSPEALANMIDLVANDSRQDEYDKYISGWFWRTQPTDVGDNDVGSGVPQAAVSGTYDGGGWANVVASYDDNGQLQHNVAVFRMYPRQEADPRAVPVRYINTQETPEGARAVGREAPVGLEGVTRSTRPISDHGLGSAWQVTELEADYDDGGTLSFYVATDVQPSDGSLDPYTHATEGTNNIEILGIPALRPDEDAIVVSIDHNDTIRGSVDGTAGTFSCPVAEDCFFLRDRWTEGFYSRTVGTIFTPDSGTSQELNVHVWGPVPASDYLAFGYWLYVPEDVTDTVNYDFGVVGSGGDPFEVSNLAGLTDTATYAGDAVGMYYVDGLTDSPTAGSFTADVTLDADFGDGNETGFISGTVNNFEYEGDVASSLPATLTLSSDAYDHLFTGFDVPQGSTNIFDSGWNDNDPYTGGHIAAEATANVDGVDWYGEWHAAFFGNGASPTDHPTGVAGTFNVSPFDDNMRVGSGLAGGFGAHRQDNQ